MATFARNRVLAAIMAFFGGSIGLHKFYLGDIGGDIGGGIFFLILMAVTSAIFPITTILGFIEGVSLLMMSDDQFDRKYNRNVIRNKRQPGSVEDRRYKQMERAKHRGVNQNRKRRQPRAKSTTSRSARSNPFKKSGIKKHKAFDLQAAIEDFKQGLQINPNDIALHFNIACSYSLTEQKEEAYYHIQRAIELGFDDAKRIESHDDLAYVRIQPEFEAFKNSGYKQSPFAVAAGGSNGAEDSLEMPQDDKLLSQLNKLAELRKRGLLSEAEFVKERKKLMRR
jgi:TM2 domain-containing membrane protein YozV